MRGLLAALGIVVCATGVACNETPRLERVTYEDVRTGPLAPSLSSRSMTVVVGTAFGAKLAAFDTSGERLHTLRLSSSDPAVATATTSGAFHVVVAHDTGTTTFAVADEEGLRGYVDVDVVPQP